MKKILIIERDQPADLAFYRDALGKSFPDLPIATAASESEALAQCAETTAIMAKAPIITGRIVAAAPQLEWIHALTAGIDLLEKIGLSPAIVITSARGMHGPQMSELAFLYMLAFLRDLRGVFANQSAARWARAPQKVMLDRTVVLVGMGLIGEELALRCKMFGMKTIGVTATPRSAPGFDEVVDRTQLRQAAARADFLIVLAPYSPETHHMIDADVFAAMRPEAVFINIARGKLCDEAALVEALRRGLIAGAGLDVFEEEPLAADSPLWAMPNVIVTPHIGGLSDRYAQQALPLMIDNLGRYLRTGVSDLRNVVSR